MHYATVEHEGYAVELELDVIVHPPEPPRMNPPSKAHPGEPGWIEPCGGNDAVRILDDEYEMEHGESRNLDPIEVYEAHDREIARQVLHS